MKYREQWAVNPIARLVKVVALRFWETNVGLRPATHIMSTFVCLAIAVELITTLTQSGLSPSCRGLYCHFSGQSSASDSWLSWSERVIPATWVCGGTIFRGMFSLIA